MDEEEEKKERKKDFPKNYHSKKNPGRYLRPGNGGARPGAGRPRGRLNPKVNKEVLGMTLIELFTEEGEDDIDVSEAKMRMEADVNITEKSSSDDLIDDIITEIEEEEEGYEGSDEE